jgi:hypothetical protein
MDESKRLLEVAEKQAPEAPFDLDDVLDRRTRHERRRKMEATVVGLGLTLLILVGAAFAAVQRGASRTDAPLQGGSPRQNRTLSMGPGEYSYQRVRITCGGCDRTTLLVESWWALNDAGRIDVVEANDYGIDEGTFGPGEFPDEGDLTMFPTDPDALTAFLLDRSGADGSSPRPGVTPAPGTPLEEGQLWLAVHDYLGSTQYLNATPELRAAMLQVLAGLPMVHTDDDVSDPLGRSATRLGFHAYDADVAVFVDPDSGDFLAMTEAYAGGGGTRTTVVEAAGIVDDDHTQPHGDQQTVRAP